eukprot:Selendium_serpulae@DN5180_c0_g2_i1.p2
MVSYFFCLFFDTKLLLDPINDTWKVPECTERVVERPRVMSQMINVPVEREAYRDVPVPVPVRQRIVPQQPNYPRYAQAEPAQCEQGCCCSVRRTPSIRGIRTVRTNRQHVCPAPQAYRYDDGHERIVAPRVAARQMEVIAVVE